MSHTAVPPRGRFVCIPDSFAVFRHNELAALGDYQPKRKALDEFERFGHNP